MSLSIFSKKKNVIYSIFIALTIILSSILFIWTLTEKKKTEVFLFDAKITLDDRVITEYIVGESVNTEGVTMYLNGKEVEFEVEADFSTAGKKEVRLIYEDGDGKHVANYPVNVYSVKHFDLRNYPNIIYKTNGVYITTGLTVWAALSDDIVTDRFMLTPENPKWYNTILLSNNVYTLTHEEIKQTGWIKTTVNLGSYKNVTFNSFVAKDGFSQSQVNGAIRVMPLYNEDEESLDTLTLFVKTANATTADSGRKMEATGVYVYEKHTSSGSTYEYYEFSYWMDDYWGSHFVSPNIDEIYENGDEDYFVSVGEQRFRALGNEWRSAFIVV